jgi:hypothetical protein
VPKTRKPLVIAASLLFSLGMMAATALTAPGAKAASYYELYWGQSGATCLTETGVETGVWLGGCGTTNHSFYWAIPAEGTTGQIINEHSGLCLTANDAGGVYLATCGTNHVQLWTRIRYDGMYDYYTNVHVPGHLTVSNYINVGTVIEMGSPQDYGDDFWNS